ncbi:MAG: acyltransferase [Rhodospirillales bacterium]|nr:acyltransferase [Rhodospirillales bacterium]
MKSDFLDPEELAALQLRSIGRNVRISRRAVLFRPGRISLGDHSRIDAFCILSAGPAGISIGRNVHVSAYSAILGQDRVTIADFATISVRCTLFSSNDDYSGLTMANATIPADFRGAIDAPVVVETHAIIGAGSFVLPGVVVGESACVGAASLVKASVAPFDVVAGVPARRIGHRHPGHRALAERLLQREAADLSSTDG